MSGRINLDNMSEDFKSYIQGLDTQLEQKNSYFTLKEFKEETVSNSEALQKCIDYICENRVISTTMKWGGVSCGGTVIDLCGCEVILDKTLEIVQGDIRYSDITFQNGTLKASDDFVDEYLMVLGKISHNRGLKFYNVTFNCNLKCSPFYMNRTLNTLFSGCTFTNLNSPAKINEIQTHESVFTNCYFTNDYAISVGHKKIDYALEIGVDSHISNCIFIGFKNGINCLGGCNMINNNHFYQIEDYAITLGEGAVVLNNIYGNYFDGCSIYIGREYADTNVVSNVFLYPQYASGIHSKYLLKRSNISNNTYLFTKTKRERLLELTCIINDNILTVEEELFNKYDIGATNAAGTLSIVEFIDSKNVKVSYDAGEITVGSKTTVWLFPTNLSHCSIATDHTLNSIGVLNENVVYGLVPNKAIKKGTVNSEYISGSVKVEIDRVDGFKYLKNSCYTTSNQSQKSKFKICSLPKNCYPSNDIYTNVIALNPNDPTDIYGNCTALISSSTGDVTIIKKVGEFNLNYVEYSFNVQYK